MKKKNSWKFIIAVVLVVSALAVFIKVKGADRIICEARGGVYSASYYKFCEPKNILKAVRKIIIGKVVQHPDDAKLEIIFKREKDGVIEAYVRDKESKEKTGQRVIAYMNSVALLPNSKSSFFLPLYIENTQGESAYLCLFNFFNSRQTPKAKNNYYENVYMMNSHNLGLNVVIDDIRLVSAGWAYSTLFSVNIHKADTPDAKETVNLRYYYELNRYEEDKGCIEPNKVISKQRGDGKSYEVCLYENGNECAMAAWEKGNCPYAGFEVSKINDEMIKYGIIQGQLLKKDGTFAFMGEDINYSIEDFYYGRRDFQR